MYTQTVDLETAEVSFDTDQSIFDMFDQIETIFLQKIKTEAIETPAHQLGLDSRCGRVWVGPDYIAVTKKSDRRMLDYYGGFEYVDSENIRIIGDTTFYFAEDSRVQDTLDYLNQMSDELE